MLLSFLPYAPLYRTDNERALQMKYFSLIRLSNVLWMQVDDHCLLVDAPSSPLVSTDVLEPFASFLRYSQNIEASGSSETSVFARIDYDMAVLFSCIPLLSLQALGCISQIRNAFLSFASQGVSLFHQPPHTPFPFYPWPSSSRRPSTVVSYTVMRR